MSRPGRLGLATVAVLVTVIGGSLWVRSGDGAPPVRTLASGHHRDVVVDEPVTLRAAPGAVVEGPLVVRADGARIEGVNVVGGDDGIVVEGARGVVLAGVTVTGATWHGISVNQGTVTISDCDISGLTSPLAQGIEIRNTLTLGRSRVERCHIDGGQEGILAHVSRVEFRDNVITHTTMRGLAVTEMSEGLVERNMVDGATGTGLYCGDLTHCEFRGNDVRGVESDGSGVTTRSGLGAVVNFSSTSRLSGNRFDVAAPEPVAVIRGSIVTDRFPLSQWPAGWRGALPAVVVAAVALAALALVRVALAPAFARIRRRWAAVPDVPGVARLGFWAFATTAAVQVVHFAEHGVQVFQVYVADAEVRTGVIGARFDTEWLHFGFNATVMAGMVVGLVLARHEVARRHPRALSWVLAALVFQTWHLIEHVARVRQFLDTGISPAPGILGGHVDLTLLHYGLNVPMTVGLLVLSGAWLHGLAVEHGRHATGSPPALPLPA